MTSSNVTLVAPVKGVVVPLADVPDPVFAEGTLGQGIALDPLGGCLHAPCAGEVIQCARTHHAFTIKSDEGVEVLVHLGLDTVALEGKGIEPCVSLGQRIEAGEPLCYFDVDQLVCEAVSLVTPLVVLDAGGREWVSLDLRAGDIVQRGDPLVVLGPERLDDDVTDEEGSDGQALERSLVLAIESGLHARPAARLRAIARDHQVSLSLLRDARTASSDSVSALMNLGLECGDDVVIRVKGRQAEAALAAAMALLTTPEGHGPGQAEAATSSAAPSVDLPAGQLAGLVASAGIATGPLATLSVKLPEVPLEGLGRKLESPRLKEALERVGRQLEAARERAERSGQTAEAEVFEAHQAWLEDPDLVASSISRLEEGLSPGQAWREALDAEADRLRATGNPILIGRIADLRDLQRQVMLEFSEGEGSGFGDITPGAIVVAEDLTPSTFVDLCALKPAGICLAAGGTTSHVAIMARARGLPCLVAMGGGLMEATESCLDRAVVLDADNGRLELEPDQARRDQVVADIAARQARAEEERAEAHLEVVTRDNRMIEVAANIGSAEEARQASDCGADGVGLMRSEFLFLGRDAAPEEDDQRQEYQASVDALGSRPVIIRTLDIGADKQLPYLTLPAVPNPALGVRGMRLWQTQPALLDTQLRALLGVKPLRHLRIMVPMVSDASELEWVRERMEALAAEMRLTELPLLGAMIEVPSAALCSAAMAKVADFLSIGTNDLTQYGLAMDREDPQLAAQADVLHPGVLRLIQATLSGTANRCPVGVCGAAAGDDLAGPLLVAMGVSELSVEPSRIASVKARLRRLDAAVIAREIDTLLAMPDAASVRKALAPLVDAALDVEPTPERILT
ncbi:phosphoenolpyruvate--protein phosphotransferase [Halomonas sp.]|uniref:phosphoenolpyruvate--protein phosphotransferase n=1 Tax=Halomonas sp. TaxID=1486246 RepID=UPI0025802047|nr:phosphoenolpyruvate--protein phosphotransferase [Halomonas sp.]MCJ8287181.1 phosphoenolpyruvate--protein phosphotransferase [Halomonas sp.]NQY71896.1 phosphoenolpyruvate--protein phosphotransferase [Halomonas sp.]